MANLTTPRVWVSIYLLVLSTQSLNSFAQHDEESHEIDEIIVSGALNRSKADTALPVHILSDENLREQAANTLGDTLQNLPGVHVTSFGIGVGQPVIRGMSGNRVSILQNNLITADASGVSQDHASALEPLLAERIEVLRGPATLLYGNGAIGGVVNVMDNVIPEDMLEEFSGAIEIRGNTVNQGQTVVAKIESGVGGFSWHLDGVMREGNNAKIPGYAIDEIALGEPADHNSEGEIENSDLEADQFSLGGAWHFDRGFIGLSISELNNNYGIPPGAHEDNNINMPGGTNLEEFIRIDMEQRRFEVKSEFNLTGLFDRLKIQITNNQYQHRELEGDEIGTRFVNDGVEARMVIDHDFDLAKGSWGVQWVQRDFSALGEEAFIPPVNIDALGLFAIEQFDYDPLILEFGMRWDNQTIQPRGQCGTDENSLSASASALWHWSEALNVYLTLNRSQRAATVEEAFSNTDLATCNPVTDENLLVEHAATARVELGDPNLNKETANSVELGITKYRGNLKWEVNAFYTQFYDFIYQADTGFLSDGETIVSRYLQDDTVFYGLESKATWLWETQADAHVDVSVFTDWVRAKLDNGEFLPRIPPIRVGMEVAWIESNWTAKISSSFVDKQRNLGANESATDGYTRWDAYADYHWVIDDYELLLFTKITNLTNEEIRDHTSFLKNYAPAAGRDISLGLRFVF